MLKQSPYHLRLVQIATCLGFILVLIDVSVVNVALEALRTAFHAELTGLQWVVNAYALVFAALLLMAGALGDRLGAKRVFMAGFAIFTVASLGCGAAFSLPSLISWRLVQGVGAALLVPNSLSLLRQVFHDDKERSRAIGWWGAGGGIALAAGPVIGGLLISALGWRSIFLINLPIGLLGLWMTYRYAPASPIQAARSLDVPGQIAAVLTLATFTFALTEASSLGWQSPVILGTVLMSLMLAGLFLWLQARHASPMLPLGLFRDATFSSATVIGLIVNLVFYGMVFIFSLFFQAVWHMTPQQAGLAFLPMMGILMVMNIIAGRLVSRVGTRPLIIAGMLISSIGYGLLLPALASQSYLPLIAPMLLAGSGIALTIPTITNATLAAVPNTQAGIASGLLNAARQVGGVIGVAIFGFFVRHQDVALFMHGMQLAIRTAVCLLLIAAVVGFYGFKTSQPGASQ